MKSGLILPAMTGDADRVLAFARRAEQLGFDGVFATDHLFPRGDISRPSLEPFATLAAIGAATERISLGTLVARVGLRHPATMAKTAAAIDDLCGGRFILGLGTGDESNRPEHEAFGIPWESSPETRRELLAETVGAVRSMFAGELWPGGKHTPEVTGRLAPTPDRAGGPPVWIGGNADELVKLAAATADGWNAWDIAIDEFERKASLLEGRIEATWAGVCLVGRDDEDLVERRQARAAKGLADAWSGSVADLMDLGEGLEDAGASWCIVASAAGDERIALIAEALL